MVQRITTVVVATMLLVVGLPFVPVAGAEVADVAGETLVERLDGLPPLADADAPGLPDASQERDPGPGALSSLEADDHDTHAEEHAGPPAHALRSEPTRTPIAFSMVGFETDGAPVPAWFRTSTDGERWTDWTHVEWQEQEAPDPGSAEAEAGRGRLMSMPVWVEEARWLQTTVAEAAPDDLAVHLIDSTGLHRGLVQRTIDAFRAAWRGSEAHASVGQPGITTRAQWGADESLRRGGPSYASAGVRNAIVHHTAGTNAYSQAQVPGIIRGIYAFHTRSNGWNDIGYNFLVDRFGHVYEGRAGGMEEAVIGAHAAGFNTGSVGVAVLGDFSEAAPPAAALEGVARLIAWKFDVHHVDVDADVTVTSPGGGGSNKHPEGAEVTLRSIGGHRDTSHTSCPGRLYDHLPWLRDRVGQLAAPMFVSPGTSPSSVPAVEAGTPEAVTFSSRMKPAGAWSLSVRDPDGQVVHTASGSGAVASATWQPTSLVPGRYTAAFSASGRRTAVTELRARQTFLRRVGGSSDPIAGAVDVSSIAFPTGGSARHAVLARADVFADAMAGGPLAGSDGPLLLNGSEELDSRVRSELERVLPAGRTVYVLGGEQALSDDVVDALRPRWQVERLGGAERTETAARVAGVVLARSGADTVMLARSEPDHAQPWADALAGGAYGAKAGVPVLLTPPGTLSAATREALDGVARTIVLGGTVAISDAVVAQLPSPTRVRGADRAGTAAAIAAQLWGRTGGADGDRVVLGGGYGSGAWTMTLAAAPLAARRDAPLLLANSGTLPPATRAYVAGLGYASGRRADGWIVGDWAAVGDDAADDLARLLR